MPENRTPEELAELAREIRRRVTEKVREAVRESADVKISVDLPDGRSIRYDSRAAKSGGSSPGSPVTEADAPSTEEKLVRTGERIEAEKRDDNFWDLGSPKPRVYEKPVFRSHSVGVTDVSAPDPEPVPGERTAASERIVKDEIPRRELDGFDVGGTRTPGAQSNREGSAGRVIRTAEGYRSVQTGSYRRHTPRSPLSRSGNSSGGAAQERRKSPGSQVVKTYSPGGALIRTVTVRTWESDTEFYNRFLTDAARSHSTPYTGPSDGLSPVPYTSFVPQYAHMSMAQLEYYRYVRESVRHGRTPPCDFPYILLYIYEIINLPELIPPEEGVRQLAALWLGYREAFPRLDGTLCEWVPDYCLIHGVSLPESLDPILPRIVPKAQLKEFYLDRRTGDPAAFARVVIENSSDYDFRNSRYYPDHRDAYERHIPAAVGAALEAGAAAGTGIFALDRTYRMTRDSYVGAVAASSVKRRIDLEFVSFTRRAETRGTVTAAVKYAENRLRAVLGVKAKLGTDGVSEEDAARIDAYFLPMLPTKEQIRRKKEDAYMPPDYLKNYEAETSGFDPDAAAAIEAESWANTSRLTGEDYGDADPSVPDDADLVPEAEGSLSTEDLSAMDLSAMDLSAMDLSAMNPSAEDPSIKNMEETEVPAVPDLPENAEKPEEHKEEPPEEDSAPIREGLRAAMDGRFRSFCRERGLYEGDLADRINAVFLDCMGDVVLETDGTGFRFIEDYREDAEEWLRTETIR